MVSATLEKPATVGKARSDVADAWSAVRSTATGMRLPDPDTMVFGSRMSVLLTSKRDRLHERACFAARDVAQALSGYPQAAVAALTQALDALVLAAGAQSR